MNDDINNQPTNVPPIRDIPEFLQGDHWYDQDTSGLYLDFTKPYVPPRWTLSHNGVPFAKVGDLHVIQGKSGHGKTALMSQFMACIIKGELGHLRYELRDVPKPVVLYIDTEMSEDDTIAVKNRVCCLAGIDKNQPSDQFKVVRLRETVSTADRWRQILKVIYEVKPTVAFLDGMLDIVDDYNDQKECQPIIRKCMTLVTHYNMSMWCVLHENPTAEKMVGTLGSVLQRKVTECFTVVKHKHDKNFPTMPDIFFQVQQPKARGKDLEDWCFKIDNTEDWGRPVELDENGHPEAPEDREARLLIAEAQERFSNIRWSASGLSRSDVDNALLQQGVKSKDRKQKLLNTAMEHEIIYKTGSKAHPKYFFKGLNPSDDVKDLPFDAPQDEQSDAPF